MKISVFITFVALFAGATLTRAQDLIHKVPAEANVLITLNTKAVFKHLDIADVNGLLRRFGVFDSLNNKVDGSLRQVENMGIDLQSRAYMYLESTDSVQYFGGLIPLSDRQHFEALFGKEKQVETVKGLKTVYSTDRTLRISWDDRTAYIIGASPYTYYFDAPDVRTRYQLPEPVAEAFPTYEYPTDYDEYAYEMAMPADSAYWDDSDWAMADTLVAAEDWDEVSDTAVVLSDTSATVLINMPPPVLNSEEMYDEVDSVLAQDQYADDYYLKYREYEQQRDSVINSLLSGWIDQRMDDVIAGNRTSYTSKHKITKISDEVIADIQVQNFGAFYQMYFPAHLLYSFVGMSSYPKIDYGVHTVSGQLVVQGNKLVLRGEAELDKEMSRYFKKIYAKKMNKKFLPHLQEDILGFMSFAADTEDYIKYMPAIFQRYYGPMAGKYDKFVDMAATFFDIILDEKAIAKVFKGDNLLVMYGVTPVKVSYTDYEYDADYNYKEVEKEKTEQVPDFLWMFSSDDMRIFEKMIRIGISENKVQDMDGIYMLEKSYNSALQLYFQMKQGIVYVGSNLAKMQEIKDNRLKQRPHKAYADMVQKDAFSVLFNTKKAPELFDSMDIPVSRQMRSTVDELGQYGDFYLRSPGIRRNRVSAELALDFPETNPNALSFLMDLLSRVAPEIK